MQNANLVNSLLGVTAPQVPANKVSTPKSNIDNSLQFQTAMEQQRLNVAAKTAAASKARIDSSRAQLAVNDAKADERPSMQTKAQRSQPTEAATPGSKHVKPEPVAQDREAVTQQVSQTKPDSRTAEQETETASEQDLSNEQDDGSAVVSTLGAELRREDMIKEGDSSFSYLSLNTELDISSKSEVIVQNDSIYPSIGLSVFTDTNSLDAKDLLGEGEHDEIGSSVGVLASAQTSLSDSEAVDDVADTVSIDSMGGSDLSSATAQSFIASVLQGEQKTNVPFAGVDEKFAKGGASNLGLATSAPLNLESDGLDGLGDDALVDDGDVKLDTSLLNPKSMVSTKAAFNTLLERQTLEGGKLLASDSLQDNSSPRVAGLAAFTEMTSALAPSARSFVAQAAIATNIAQPQWGQAVSDKVLWMAAQNISSAEIRLDPPELGPMQVKVTVHQDQVNVNFTSPHAQVRDALDAQLNRLRDMFAEQGMNQVNVDVSDKSFARQEQESRQDAKGQRNGTLDEDDHLEGDVNVQPLSLRLVDHYA